MKTRFFILATLLAFTMPMCAQTETNEVIENMMARRSIRKYLDKPVEHAKLEQIAICGINAPSGMNAQPWIVRVVEDQKLIADVNQAAERSLFYGACVATPKDRGQLDAGMLGENMMLAAQSLGLGTCCLGGPVRFLKANEEAKPYLDRLGFSEGYELLYILAIGYPDEQPAAKPRDLNKIKYVK